MMAPVWWLEVSQHSLWCFTLYFKSFTYFNHVNHTLNVYDCVLVHLICWYFAPERVCLVLLKLSVKTWSSAAICPFIIFRCESFCLKFEGNEQQEKLFLLKKQVEWELTDDGRIFWMNTEFMISAVKCVEYIYEWNHIKMFMF